ncbi:hypothetical protein HOY34_19665 [Xinfangfangia sp. D13-10-4-6]|uniref:PfkB family carbohydrate kinase n=1 Tax=Pseudogemmobacter hezensis TaxID=2737662 RepID=UPI001554727E|nr:PfkB family carbohydrate kinase [Pseudogemmobacter hezensis]NPD17407.1 hypothetical protein [Pseudogemmobacter hezensis]
MGNLRRPVMVVGHINHDRIWRLSERLVSGGRQRWTEREISRGGGAFFTGNRLHELGHRVEYVSALASDAMGQETFAALQAAGFGTAHIARGAPATVLTEILLAPDGERTILQAPGRQPVFDLSGPPPEAGAAYLNIHHIGAGLREALSHLDLVLLQLPLIADAEIAADYAITSAADFADLTPGEILARARGVCGARLRALILTDGPGPVLLLPVQGDAQTIPINRPLVLKNSIGAGDSYAGGLCHALSLGMSPAQAVEHAGTLARDWLLQNRCEDQ